MDRRPKDRVLVAVLFLDIVGSTEVATELGDERWQELLRRYRGVVRGQLRRFRGREVDTAGDGFFATFERPADGVSAAGSIVEAVRELGIEVRAGLHFGECEVRGAELSGIAVHTGARVMGLGGPGEVLVTATVRDLVAGARLQFEGWGVHTLKGVPGEWRLYALVSTDGQGLGSPLDEETAAERRDAITPAPARQRRAVVLVVGGLALAAAVTTIVLLTRDEPDAGDGRGGAITTDALVRIDPATNEVVARIGPLPRTEPRSRFMDVAVGQGGVWVDTFESGMLTKVDPRANRIEGTMTIGATIYNLAVIEGLEGAVWITASERLLVGPSELVRVDAASERVVARLELDVPRAAFFPDTPLATTEDGALWVLNPQNGTVWRVDTSSNRIAAEVRLGSGTQTAFAAGEGGISVGDDLENVVYRIDPGRAEVVAEIPVSNGASELAVGDGAVWALNNVRGTLTRIDPATNEVRETIPVGGNPTGLAVGDGVVWITDRVAGIVRRVNVATRDVTSIPVGGAPEGIALSEDAVWVAVGRI